MRASRRLAVVVAASTAFAMATAACGGDDDSSAVEHSIKDAVKKGNLDDGKPAAGQAASASAVPDPCVLVTAADAASLFGEAARTGTDTSPVDLGRSCIYENTDSDDLGQVGHLLQVRVFPGEQFFSTATYDDERSLDDLGDRAFVRSGQGALAGVDVQFVKDGKTVTFSYSTVNIGVEKDADRVEAADREDQVVALARQAADRM
jgi:hypothetical protein